MLKIKITKSVEELVNMFYNAKIVTSTQVTTDEDGVSYQTMSPSWTSNENSSYMHRLITKEANILTIAGSFDHIIDMALYGARKIYAVDVNLLQFPIDWLKYQSVMYLTSNQFRKFAINTGTNMLSKEIMCHILEKAEKSHEKEFWRKVYEENSSIDIRMNYLINERSYITHHSKRLVKFEYPEYNLWQKARKALKEAEIYIEEKDIFDVKPLENSFDLIHLSNIHNFYNPEEFCLKIRQISKYLKKGGTIVLYCIGMKPEWFELIKKGYYTFQVYERDFNMDVCRRNPLLLEGLQQQISFTMFLYRTLLNDFDVEVIPVETGKGFVGYNTSTDVVLAIKPKI